MKKISRSSGSQSPPLIDPLGVCGGRAYVEQVRKQVDAGMTLPSSFYTDPRIFELERRTLLGRSWQYAGPLEQVREPGSFLTAQAGDVPIVVVRDLDHQLRAFINVCRHRAAEVVQGRGKASALQCHYHGWTYGLDGSLKAAPRCQHEEGFELVDFPLHPASVAVYGPLVFVHPETSPPKFEDSFPGLVDIDWGGIDFDSLRFHSRAQWQVQANWKVLAENYLECYHCQLAHPEFSRLMKVNPDNYENTSRGGMFHSTTPLRASTDPAAVGRPYDPGDGVDRGNFVLLWPNTTINAMPGVPNLYVLGFTPNGVDQSCGFKDYFLDASADEDLLTEMTDYFTRLGLEDKGLVESVQRGLASGRVPRGRLITESEQLVQRFQAMFCEELLASI